MSGRMRTGQVTAGPSREAAYGVALSQEVKVTDRPVTQQVKRRGGLGSRGPCVIVSTSYVFSSRALFIMACRTQASSFSSSSRVCDNNGLVSLPVSCCYI